MRFKFKSTSMDPNLVECEAERASCACAESGLGVLGDVRRQYEEMMQLLERRGGNDKLQKQVDLLRSWVGDLVAQNALLVRTVEDLETEATAKLMVERRRHLEHAQCRDWEPVKDYNVVLREEKRRHEEKLIQTEISLKSLNVMMNVALSEDLHAMRRVCAALEEQCRAESTRAQFQEDIIREMRRQLKQAKAKLKDVQEKSSVRKDCSGDKEESLVRGYESVTVACVRRQPRRVLAAAVTAAPAHAHSDEDMQSRFASQESLEQD